MATERRWDWDCEGGWTCSVGGVLWLIFVLEDGRFYVERNLDKAGDFSTFLQAKAYAGHTEAAMNSLGTECECCGRLNDDAKRYGIDPSISFVNIGGMTLCRMCMVALEDMPSGFRSPDPKVNAAKEKYESLPDPERRA